MSRGAVREPHRPVRQTPTAQRTRRELRDVRHPLRPALRIEWILVAPSGVFVVSTAATCPGTPAASPGTAAAAPGEMTAAGAPADVVATVLPARYRGRVRAVLCRTDGAAVAEDVDGVLVTTLDTLTHVVSRSPVVLSTSELDEIALRLSSHLEPWPVAAAQPRRRWRRRHGRAFLGLAGTTATVAALAWTEVLPLP